MLLTAHLHHSAPFSRKDIKELLTPPNPGLFVPHPDLFKHETKATPPVLRAFGAKHGVRANDIKILGQDSEVQILSEFFNRQDINKQRASLKSLQREGLESLLGREYGIAEQNDIRMSITEVMRTQEERNAEGQGGDRVVGAGVGEYCVALGDEGLGQELAVVSKANDGNFKVAGKGHFLLG